jgi:hypothetical protein
MANPEHVAILKQGVAAWNKWRSENRHKLKETLPPAILLGQDSTEDESQTGFVLTTEHIKESDLAEVDLRSMDLRGINLSGVYLHGINARLANLSDGDFSGSRIFSGDFRNAKLEGADFRKAHILGASFEHANLARALFREARFLEVNLSYTDLGGADLTNAAITWINLAGIDLSEVRGLDTIRHSGPSSLGLDTIYRSKGKVSKQFLRGCGVPEEFIQYMHSLVAAPIDFYSCFISYSSLDHEFAEQLHSQLQSEGVRCWFAPQDLKTGDEFRTRIDESIRIYDKLLVVLSENSIRSRWVQKEVETAFEKERSRRGLVLFPIRIDDAIMETDKAWAADIRRTRHVGDFRGWKDSDFFETALNRLIRDLKASANASG